ncbi:MAG: hypothetical protein KJ057_05515 [Phycisphaerae bacterium]|nr:MAG: hypothetical protein EDS66_02275 [Planctomycetota bacterium]KAB2947022.1 MAG: hypothetical protein F9K17_07885 [Phycisphaerae bacterium]MBE7456877.1 hypothetical protein [Planctomycetia bacterium]MCK6464324.1 hypothetical protein [Phycisphaerae bacterium]MCL4717917.1 hypothetical protein [Phycisphaerae bacterium]
MTTDTKTTLDPTGHTGAEERSSRFEANLVVLARHRPSWAARVASAAGNSEPATARDGTATFRVTDPQGRRRWFGGSSMPTSSSAALFGNLSDTNMSVVLPGILTGAEVLTVDAQLDPGCAIFVCESDPAALRLALMLYDYRPLIEAGRLCFVDRDRVIADLAAFFESHPGYEFPQRVLRTPQIDPATFAKLQKDLEAALREVTAARAQRAEQSRRRIADQLSAHQGRGVLIVGAGVSSDARAAALGLQDAFREPGSCDVVLISDPRTRHLQGVLDRIERIHADVLILLDGAPAVLRPQIPDAVRLVTWLTPQVDPRVAATWATQAQTPCFVSTTEQLRAVLDPASGADHVQLLEPGVTARAAACCVPTPVQAGAPLEVCVPPCPPDDPDLLGLTLASQRDLWTVARSLIFERILAGRTAAAAELLTEASAKANVAIEDAQVRRQFLELIQRRALPAARWRTVVTGLTKSGARVRTLEPLSTETPACYVCPAATHADARRLCERVTSGAPVFAWRYFTNLREAHPMLQPLLDCVIWFDRPEEVVRGVLNLGRTSPRIPDPRVLADNDMSARLRCLIRAARALLQGA